MFEIKKKNLHLSSLALKFPVNTSSVEQLITSTAQNQVSLEMTALKHKK